MSRIKGGYKTRQRRKKILKSAKGYWGGKHRLYRSATEAVDRARRFAYRDRRVKKRDFRSLWIIRINAAARLHEISYSNFILGLKNAGVQINRKILSDLASQDQRAFAQLAAIAKEHLPA